MKLCIFDLDETLVTNDSLKYYLANWFLENKISIIKKSYFFFKIILFKILFDNRKFKEQVINLCFKGENNKKIINFNLKFSKKLLKKVNYKVLNKLKYYKKKNYTICLATASPDFYVNIFAKKLKIKNVICTQTFFFKNEFRIKGENCKGLSKKKKVVKKFPKYLKYQTVFFTNDFIDLPLMKVTKKNFIVNGDVIKRIEIK